MSGYPLADAVKWYKNGKKIERGEATSIHSHGNTVISSELTIFNATAYDTGNYTCHRSDGKSAQVLGTIVRLIQAMCNSAFLSWR